MPAIKPGQKITAKWARELQNRHQQSPSVDMVRTASGPVIATPSVHSVDVYALNGATELPPFSLVGLKKRVTPPTEDGRMYLEVTAANARSELLVTNGNSTVPANGSFLPIWPDLTPRRYKAEAAPVNFQVGGPCGRKKDGTTLTSREGGLICVKDRDAQGYAWAIADDCRIWDGYTVGGLTAGSVLAGPVCGIGGIILANALSNLRVDICSRSAMTLVDGVYITLAFSDRWHIIWADCGANPAIDGEAAGG